MWEKTKRGANIRRVIGLSKTNIMNNEKFKQQIGELIEKMI